MSRLPIGWALSPLALSLFASGCGVPAADYDARTAELRRAEERLKSCSEEAAQSRARAEQAESAGQRSRTPSSEAEERAFVQRVRAEAKEAKAAAAQRKTERDSLATSLKDELQAGVIWLDDRGGVNRLVIPEEALFSSGSSSVGPPGRKVLDVVVRQIKEMPPRALVVAGYVDRSDKSKPKDDLILTLDRSRKVVEYLVKQGLEPDRITASGLGAADPVADNSNEDLRVRNRRVEVELRGFVGTSRAGGSKAVSSTAGGSSSTIRSEAASPAPHPTGGASPSAEPKPAEAKRAPAPSIAGDDPGL